MATDHTDPVVPGGESPRLRWWIVTAVVTTLLAATVITAAVLASRQPPWEPVPVQSGVPA